MLEQVEEGAVSDPALRSELAQLPHFHALPGDLLESIAAGSRRLCLLGDEVLFCQGDPARVGSGRRGGIGSAIVARLAEAGARTVSVDLANAPKPAGVRAFECDLRDSADVRLLFERLRAEDLEPDVLVHSVGITRDAVLWKLDDDAWHDVMTTNLDSAFYLLRAAVAKMRERGRGAVVVISSINGERGKFGQSNYVASKSGLIGLARTAARELGRFGIRVNVIAPGFVRTAMTDHLPSEVIEAALRESVLERVCEPDDIANTALYLCSALSARVTGQVLRVDGGQLIA